jgi:hypothetical protein
MRYHLKLQLDKSDNQTNKISNIYTNKSYLKKIVIEIITLLITPHIFFDGIKINAKENWNNKTIIYELNYILILFSFVRFYGLINFIISTTKYYNYRAFRIAKMMGMLMTFNFAIKCILSKNPFRTIIFIIVIFVFLFSYMLRIIEGPDSDFNTYGNCLWFALVTMTTVGYGDYVPRSNLGRILTFLAAVLGSIQVSILIYSSQTTLLLDEKENQVYSFTSRLESKSEIDKVSASYFKSTLLFIGAKNELFTFLKEKTTDIAYINEEEENKSTKTVYENIKKLEILKENFYHRIYDRIDKKRSFKETFQ